MAVNKCFHHIFHVAIAEAAVRIEVMEQIPHVAVLCVEHRGLHYAIPQYILPVVVRYLTDPNNQVMSQFKKDP